MSQSLTGVYQDWGDLYYPVHCAWNRQHLFAPCTHHLQYSVLVSWALIPRKRTARTYARRIAGVVLIFIEIPFLLRICPTSDKVDNFIRRFTTNWMRAAMYLAMSAVQWISLVTGASSLIAAAVMLLIASLFYALAGLKSQDFVGSKTLGGQGLAQMIV